MTGATNLNDEDFVSYNEWVFSSEPTRFVLVIVGTAWRN